MEAEVFLPEGGIGCADGVEHGRGDFEAEGVARAVGGDGFEQGDEGAFVGVEVCHDEVVEIDESENWLESVGADEVGDGY